MKNPFRRFDSTYPSQYSGSSNKLVIVAVFEMIDSFQMANTNATMTR
jgi:hypothetical protein